METPIVNHLFLTTQYLVKGHVESGDQRLTDMLRNYPRPFLAVNDATLSCLDRPEQVTTTQVQLRLHDVILGYEFLDLSGDLYRRVMSEASDQEYQLAGLPVRRLAGVEIVGRMRVEVLKTPQPEGFFVMRNPVIRGVKGSGPDFEHLGRLPYAIINWGQIHCIFPFS